MATKINANTQTKKKKKKKKITAFQCSRKGTFFNQKMSTFSADNFFNYFSCFSQKTGFDTSCKLSPVETILMNCQIMFSGKNKENIINLPSVEFYTRE